MVRQSDGTVTAQVTGTAQVFAFAILSWNGLWTRLHVPNDTWMPFLTQIVGITGAMMMPCLRSTIAALGSSGETRASVAILLGAIGAEQTLFGIIGPAIWPPVWAWTEDSMPALSYYVGAGLTALGVAAMLALPALEGIEQKAAAAAARAAAMDSLAGSPEYQRRASAASLQSLNDEGTPHNKRGLAEPLLTPVQSPSSLGVLHEASLGGLQRQQVQTLRAAHEVGAFLSEAGAGNPTALASCRAPTPPVAFADVVRPRGRLHAGPAPFK